MTEQNKTLNFAEFRTRLGDGPEYWRSLEELSRTDDFDSMMRDEFPQQALPLDRGVDRRDFVKLMSASMAFAGLAACRQPEQSIVPYVKQPENFVPGKPLFFATAMPLAGYANGVLAESHLGRPTKIEGNPDHPSTLGASDAFMQASILGLYDPDRSQVVRKLGEISTWSEFIAALQPILGNARTNGAGLRLLTQTITSPTLGAQIQQLIALYPGVKWHQWEPAGHDNVREGARVAFGSYLNPIYDFKNANVVVSLASDFLSDGPAHLRYARDFMSRRRVRKGSTSMNRLYVIEASSTTTGSVADHRVAVRPSEVEGLGRAIAAGVGLSGAPVPSPAHQSLVAAIVKDLQVNRGASIVIAGDEQPPVVHAIAHAINQALGNNGSTVTVTDSPEVAPVNQLESLRQLATDMNAGAVKALIILGGNPVFDAPSDFNFRAALDKVPFRAHLSHYYDETSMHAHWHVPETHYLETWGDGRAYDGTVTIMQPLIAPLYNGRSAIEVMGVLIGGLDQSPHDAVRAYWAAHGAPQAATDPTWRKWLHDGLVAGSALPAKAASASTAVPPATGKEQRATGSVELHIRHDPTIFDGRFANNGWLQELPKPQTKIAWENAMLMSQRTAQRLAVAPTAGMVNEKRTVLADVTYRGVTLRLPVWVVPGHPDDTATICYGYGRTRAGRLGNGVGVNVYPFRHSDAMNGGPGVQIANANKGPYPIACTQEHQSLNPEDIGADRGIIRSATFTEYLKNPDFAKVEAHEAAEHHENGDISMYPQYEYPNYRWAMSIDTSVCTGCNGCVMACQSENNIPIVGKDQVVREREMHWLRIDRYYRGSVENPEVYHQPVPCMQCESAPCEPVCPVGATSHNDDGLNDMTYNRCVGTRYCSNNCPYKVRRFNFYHYSDYDTPALKPMRNPDVTVRTRGVMEKCTYCVQRVNAAKITAEKENRRVRDGELTTACAQACPTEAIVFGDLNDPNSHVSQLKREPTNYALLEELNTRPRTTYLAVVRNPNPEWKG
jgi:molybdopterin-containing oxidoreductase family iron-sulfur binding subunit